jgi:hypothetical protein
MVQQTSRGLEVEASAGVLRHCDTWRGRDEIAQYRDEAWCTRPQNKTIFVTEAAGWARKIEARRLCGRRAISTKVLGSEFSRQIAVDFESNANLHKRGSCPGHSHLPFLSEEHQTYSGPFQVARSAGRDMRLTALRRNWRVAHHCGVPERLRPMCLSARLLIDKSALIAARSMRVLKEAINQH